MSILNFHSHHPFYVKQNTVVEMIRRARFNTDPEHETVTEALLRRILENSSYPESFIVEKMHVDVHVPLSPLPPRTTIPNGVFPGYRFVSCPYQRTFVATTKQLISMNKLPAKLAVKPMLKNRDKLYRNVKDFRPHLQMKDSVFLLFCQMCDFRKFVTTGQFDLRRRLQFLLDSDTSDVKRHLAEFPTHSFGPPKLLKAFHKRADVLHSEDVLRHLTCFDFELGLEPSS